MSSDLTRALHAAALTLAAKQIGKGAPELPAGKHYAKLTVHIEGDILVGEPTDAESNTFSDADLVAQMTLSLAERQRRGFIERSIDALKETAATKGGQKDLREGKKTIKHWIEERAAQKKLRKHTRRRGSVTGEPEAHVVRDASLVGEGAAA